MASFRQRGGKWRARVQLMVHCYAEAGNDLRLTALSDGNVIETHFLDQIISLAQAHTLEVKVQVGFIVIDHARRVMTGNRIPSDHVTALLRGLNKVAVNTGSAVCWLIARRAPSVKRVNLTLPRSLVRGHMLTTAVLRSYWTPCARKRPSTLA